MIRLLKSKKDSAAALKEMIDQIENTTGHYLKWLRS